MYMSDGGKRILFLGNGVNRVVKRNGSYSWDAALQGLERKYLKPTPSVDVPVEGDSVSYGLRLQRVLNCQKKEEQKVSFGNWLNDVRKISPNYVHHLLATLVEDGGIDAVLTTNYDFAFEKALNASFEAEQKAGNCFHVNATVWRRAKDVKEGENETSGPSDNQNEQAQEKDVTIYHIHGAATNASVDGKERVTMTVRSYARNLSSLNSREENSWLQLFCRNEVHICGFAFYAEEIVIWEALKQRLAYIRENDVFSELKNRLYVYLFYTEKDKAQQMQLADLLKSYAAEPILIPVGDGDYANAWMAVYGRISLRVHNFRMTNGESDVLGRFRYPQHDTRNKNVRSAYSPSLYYPHCCKFEVPLEKHPSNNIWLFYCEVHRSISCWMGLYSEITESILKLGKVRKKIKTSTPKASQQWIQSETVYTCFYLDYTTGELFVVKENEKILCSVCKLTFISRIPDFDSLIVPLVKK